MKKDKTEWKKQGQERNDRHLLANDIELSIEDAILLINYILL